MPIKYCLYLIGLLILPVSSFAIDILNDNPTTLNQVNQSKSLSLPSLPVLSSEDNLQRILIASIRIKGNTILLKTEIESIAGNLIGKRVTMIDLEKVSQDLSQAVKNKGYLDAKFSLSKQSINDGIVTFEASEAMVTELIVTGDARVRQYVSDRIAPSLKGALNYTVLQKSIRELKTEKRIKNIEASLLSTQDNRYKKLYINVKEKSDFYAQVSIDNNNSIFVGSEALNLIAGKNNLSGRGDAFSATISKTEYSLKGGGQYQFPHFANSLETSVYAYLASSEISPAIIQKLAPGFSSELAGNSTMYGFNATYTGYRPFKFVDNFSTAIENIRYTSLLNGSSEYESNSLTVTMGVSGSVNFKQVDNTFKLALKSALSNTEEAVGLPSESSNYALLQFASASTYKLPGKRLVYSLDMKLQHALTDIPRIEKRALGGSSMVRGYHEATFTKANYAVARNTVFAPIKNKLTAYGFMDAANGNDDSDSQNLLSIGAGAIWKPHKKWNVQSFVGVPLINKSDKLDNLQDYGISFSLNYKIQ